MAPYLVMWSLDMQSNITNRFPNPKNQNWDVYLDYFSSLKVNYSISCFPAKIWQRLLSRDCWTSNQTSLMNSLTPKTVKLVS